MEWINSILDSSTTPIITAFFLGLLTAISPCPLATNIAAIGFIGKDIEDRKQVLLNGLLYTLGRTFAYTVLGVILIYILHEGASFFNIQKWLATFGEMIIGPVLLLIGLFMLFGSRLKLQKFGFGGNGEQLGRRGKWGALVLGMLFALAFCPTSGVLYFCALIPLSAGVTGGFLLPIVFALATALPVLIVAFLIAFSMKGIGNFYGSMQKLQKWMNWIVGILFIAVGIYYCLMLF